MNKETVVQLSQQVASLFERVENLEEGYGRLQQRLNGHEGEQRVETNLENPLEWLRLYPRRPEGKSSPEIGDFVRGVYVATPPEDRDKVQRHLCTLLRLDPPSIKSNIAYLHGDKAKALTRAVPPASELRARAEKILGKPSA